MADKVIECRDGQWYLIDPETEGTILLPYDSIWNYHEDRARVELNGKYGFIDLEGKEVIPLLYDWVNNFSEGRARVQLNGKRGVVGLEGNEVIPCWYTGVSKQPYGFMTANRVSAHGHKRVYFDRDGNLIAEPITK
jgi:hypothetical protein